MGWKYNYHFMKKLLFIFELVFNNFFAWDKGKEGIYE